MGYRSNQSSQSDGKDRSNKNPRALCDVTIMTSFCLGRSLGYKMNTSDVEQDRTTMGDTAPDCPIEEGPKTAEEVVFELQQHIEKEKKEKFLLQTTLQTALEKLSQSQADVASREEDNQKLFQRLVTKDNNLRELFRRNTDLLDKLKSTKAELDKKDKTNQELEVKLKEKTQEDPAMQVSMSSAQHMNGLRDLLENLEEDCELSGRGNRYLQGELQESQRVTAKLREYLIMTKQDLKEERLRREDDSEVIRRLKETIVELERKVQNQDEHEASLSQKIKSLEIELEEEKRLRLKAQQRELDAKEKLQLEVFELQERLAEVTEERDQFERSESELEEERRKSLCYERAFEKIEEEQCNFQKVTEENQRAREEKQKEIAVLKEQLEHVRKEKEDQLEREIVKQEIFITETLEQLSKAEKKNKTLQKELERESNAKEKMQRGILALLERLEEETGKGDLVEQFRICMERQRSSWKEGVRAGNGYNEEIQREILALKEKLNGMTREVKDQLKKHLEGQKRLISKIKEQLDEERRKNKTLQEEMEQQRKMSLEQNSVKEEMQKEMLSLRQDLQKAQEVEKPADDLKSHMERQKRIMKLYLERLRGEEEKSRTLQEKLEQQTKVSVEQKNVAEE
ncbi:hypothetical protein WMY93_000122 [Mugilogobius chulae]|uniref:Trichohyalin-like n=1 Tax=Mugilogobius chulae TaxID=88201 RepID=A0AAW0PYG0_9GOBI